MIESIISVKSVWTILFRTKITGEDHGLFAGSITLSSNLLSTYCCSSARCLITEGYGCGWIGLTSCVVMLSKRTLQYPKSLELSAKDSWRASSTEWNSSCWSCGRSWNTLALIRKVMSGSLVTKENVFVSAQSNSSNIAKLVPPMSARCSLVKLVTSTWSKDVIMQCSRLTLRQII